MSSYNFQNQFKVISVANYKWHWRQVNQSKRVRLSCNWFYVYFWLDKKTFCKIKLSLFSTQWELLCLIFNSSCHNGSVTCSSDVKCLIGESRVPYQLFFHVKLISCSPGNIHTHPMEGISRSVLNPFVLKLYHANNFLLHLIVPISPFKIQSWHFCSSLWAWSGYAKQL